MVQQPNYPGRSSHICNGGFVVPSRWRGMKIGVNLGRAFLYYAPKLGQFSYSLIDKRRPRDRLARLPELPKSDYDDHL